MEFYPQTFKNSKFVQNEPPLLCLTSASPVINTFTVPCGQLLRYLTLPNYWLGPVVSPLAPVTAWLIVLKWWWWIWLRAYDIDCPWGTPLLVSPWLPLATDCKSAINLYGTLSTNPLLSAWTCPSDTCLPLLLFSKHMMSITCDHSEKQWACVLCKVLDGTDSAVLHV